jgi:SAM-dependent methyltransferase
VTDKPRDDTPRYFGKDLEAMSFARNYHKWILAEFLPYLGHSVAEVGAGMGSFSALVLEAGIGRLAAFEPSANMFPHLQHAVGHDVRAKAVNDFFRADQVAERFDSILYVNVLEHIEDDAAEVANAREALNPGGHLLIFVPALPWLYSELDRKVGHFRRYIKKDLEQLVSSRGFSIVRARYFDLAGVIPWYVNFVLLGNSIGSGSVSAYDKVVVPIMRRVEGLLTPTVGKNVILTARKD